MSNDNFTGGRHLAYSEEVAERVLEAIMTHPMGLRKLCQKYPHLPSRATIQMWVAKNKSFSDRYMRAKAIQAHLLKDEIIDVVNGEEEDSLLKVNRDKLKSDGYKFLSTQLDPKQKTDSDILVDEFKQFLESRKKDA